MLAPVAEDLARLDALIGARLDSDVALVREVARYIVASGGKRLRPALLLLACRALGYAGEPRFQLAAVVEFIHTATLLHDDVVDESHLRRGRSTANAALCIAGDSEAPIGDPRTPRIPVEGPIVRQR